MASVPGFSNKLSNNFQIKLFEKTHFLTYDPKPLDIASKGF
jgi:hypothetical protein